MILLVLSLSQLTYRSRIGGLELIVSYRQNDVERERLRPVMVATTTKSIRYWHPIFEDDIKTMIRNLGAP